MLQTMKVKPWGADQGDHVIINAEDFDAASHVPFEEPAEPVVAQETTRRTRRTTTEPAAQE